MRNVADHRGWWWLSFADQDRPEGERFLGVLIVYGPTFGDAIDISWSRKLNPGGEVLGFGIDDVTMLRIEPKYRDRLLTRNEATAVSAC